MCQGLAAQGLVLPLQSVDEIALRLLDTGLVSTMRRRADYGCAKYQGAQGQRRCRAPRLRPAELSQPRDIAPDLSTHQRLRVEFPPIGRGRAAGRSARLLPGNVPLRWRNRFASVLRT